jgi:hypothetical protein
MIKNKYGNKLTEKIILHIDKWGIIIFGSYFKIFILAYQILIN